MSRRDTTESAFLLLRLASERHNKDIKIYETAPGCLSLWGRTIKTKQTQTKPSYGFHPSGGPRAITFPGCPSVKEKKKSLLTIGNQP